jgi:hypothetical protein
MSKMAKSAIALCAAYLGPALTLLSVGATDPVDTLCQGEALVARTQICSTMQFVIGTSASEIQWIIVLSVPADGYGKRAQESIPEVKQTS